MFRRTEFTKKLSLLSTVMFLVAFSTTLSAYAGEPVHFLGVQPTSTWVDFYGTTFTIQGAPAEIGDEVGVFDPDGVLCGAFAVEVAGMYGFVHVYGDDPTTGEDEGAGAGDALTFVAWDASEDVEIECIPLGPDDAVWTADGDRWNVNLEAEQETGDLEVTLEPPEAVAAGAQWRVDGGGWQASGATVPGLTVGAHTVTCSIVLGWDVPGPQIVMVTSGLTQLTRTYVQQLGDLEVTLEPPEAVAA
jgi:hypothetical protein